MKKRLNSRFNSNVKLHKNTSANLLPRSKVADKIRSMKLNSRFISHPLRNAQSEFSQKRTRVWAKEKKEEEEEKGRKREREKKSRIPHFQLAREKSSSRSRYASSLTEQRGHNSAVIKPRLFPDEQYLRASMASRFCDLYPLLHPLLTFLI